MTDTFNVTINNSFRIEELRGEEISINLNATTGIAMYQNITITRDDVIPQDKSKFYKILEDDTKDRNIHISPLLNKRVTIKFLHNLGR